MGDYPGYRPESVSITPAILIKNLSQLSSVIHEMEVSLLGDFKTPVEIIIGDKLLERLNTRAPQSYWGISGQYPFKVVPGDFIAVGAV